MYLIEIYIAKGLINEHKNESKMGIISLLLRSPIAIIILMGISTSYQ